MAVSFWHCVFIWTCIFFKGARVRSNECHGQLSIDQPAVLDRRGRLRYQDDTLPTSQTITWKRGIGYGNSIDWQTLRNETNAKLTQNDLGQYLVTFERLGSRENNTHYYLIIYPTTNDQICTSKTVMLRIVSFTQCGSIHLLTERIKEDTQVEIAYYPSESVYYGFHNMVQNDHKWYRIDPNCPDGCEISVTNTDSAIYKESERPDSPNNNNLTVFVLKLMSMDASVEGRYGVRCKYQNGSEVATETVEVRIPETNTVALWTTTDSEDCSDCVYGQDNSQREIYCNATGEQPASDVRITIGDNQVTKSATRNKDGSYKASVKIRDSYHLKNVTCTAIFPSATVMDSKPLYVTKKPNYPVLVMNTSLIIEHEPVNITCIFPGGRPAPNVTIEIDGVFRPNEQINTFDNVTLTYTATASIYTVKREWNKKIINYCSVTYMQEERCGNATLLVKFAPSKLLIDLTVPSITHTDNNDTSIQLTATCQSVDASPKCVPKINGPHGSQGTNPLEQSYNSKNGGRTSKITQVLTVRREDYGKLVFCNATCLGKTMSKSAKIVFLHAPQIRFDVPNASVNVISGKSKRIRCLVDSYPVSDIFWTRGNASLVCDEGSTCCKASTTCSIDIWGEDLNEAKNYTCHAIHKSLGNVSKSIIVNTFAPVTPEDSPRDKKIDQGRSGTDGVPWVWIIVGATCFLLVIIAVVVAVLLAKRRRKQPDEAQNQDARVERINADHEVVPLNTDDVTYAQIDKPRKRNAAECSPAPVDSAQPKTSDGKQLIYAELELATTSASALGGDTINRRDSPTEYVGIDFARSAESGDRECKELTTAIADEEAVYANE